MRAEDLYRCCGYGTMREWYYPNAPHPTFALATQSEEYPEYGFRVIWCGTETYGQNNRTVLALEDLP